MKKETFEKYLRIINDGDADIEALAALIGVNDNEQCSELYDLAFDTMKKYTSGEVHLRSLVEFSNICRKNCAYCGIRRGNKDQTRFRMTPQEVIELGIDSAAAGFKTVVLQGGEDPFFTREIMADIITGIKEKADIALTLSIGERPMETYEYWREKGADRYLMRIETTNRKLFKSLHCDDDFDERVEALKNIKQAGYELGTGVMIGLPGQSDEDLAKDIVFFKEIDADMIGIGPFIPHDKTPLKDHPPGDLRKTLNFLALLRILMKNINIPATTALGTLDPFGRQRGLKAGCNVLMPNYTPRKYRPLYKLYDNKICIFESAENCFSCTRTMAGNAGLKVAEDKGFRYGTRRS